MLLRSTLQHWYRNAACSKISLSSTNLNPSTPRSQRKFFILSVIQFLWCYFEEFGIGSTNNYPNDIYLYSYHLSSCHCVFLKTKCLGHSWDLKGKGPCDITSSCLMALSLSSINSTETSSSACTWNPLPALKDIYQREIKSSEREK